MPFAAGTRFGKYEIRKPLGAGGMGEVYLAQDTRLRRLVALKLLLPKYTGDEDRLRRFEQEACAASALNHQNIITVYDIDTHGDAHFIAAEYVEGETLRDHLARRRPRLREALDIAAQAHGLQDGLHLPPRLVARRQNSRPRARAPHVRRGADAGFQVRQEP